MHLASFMFKNALLNADKKTKNDFLSSLKRVIKLIIKEESIKVTIDDMEYFDNKALYQFTIPTKSKSQRAAYSVFLQTLRIVALLHDVGHLPFSHQVEYALKKVYDKIKQKEQNLEILCKKELRFKNNYEFTMNLFELLLENAKFKNCIVAIISFHSLEDRIVKNYFKKWTKSCICPSGIFRCECGNNHALGKIITKKPIIPTNEEIKQNPRSRSSKLRIFKFD